MKKLLLGCFVFLLAALSGALPARALESEAFAAFLTAEEGRDRDTVDLVLSYNGVLGPIGSFTAWVEYDPDCWEYQRVRQSPALLENVTTVSSFKNRVGVIYSACPQERVLESPEDILTFRFRLREDARPGKTSFSVFVSQVTDLTPQFLEQDLRLDLGYTVLDPPSNDATLRHLIPSEGALEPAFSPEHFNYYLTVPFPVTSISFLAQPAPGASSRVNRKNLGAGGSETEFCITVTAEDGKTRREYYVVAYREEKASPSPSSSPLASPSPTPKSQEAFLLSLLPEEGQLEPAFSPDILEYNLAVPFSITSLSWSAEAAPGASWRVNRKNLGAGGSKTDFIFTVTAEDGETRQEYRVTVYRQEKETSPSTPKPVSTPKPTAAPKSPAAEKAGSNSPNPVLEEAPGSSLPEESEDLPTVPIAAEETPSPPPGAPVEFQSSRPLWPLGLGIGTLVAIVLISGPFSQWLARRWEQKAPLTEQKEPEELEKEDSDEDDEDWEER